MAIIKIIKRENPYIQIDKTGINDNRLSWGASGLLAYLAGRPKDWNVNLSHLATVKDKDKKDKTRKYLNELRNFGYCHYFEIRKAGKIIQNFYLVFEVPTKYQEVLENFIDIPENCTVHYKEVSKQKATKKIIENKELLPRLENPTSVITTSVNPTLLIKEYTKERNTNNRTTTKDIKNDLEKNKKISSSYEFLDLKEFKLLNAKTKSNIRNNISELSKEKFEEIYNSVKAKYESNKIQNFNGFLYQALNENWDILSKTALDTKKELGEDKKEWLRYFSGICSDKNLKAEIENIIADIPFEVLRKNKSKLSCLEIFDFKSALYQLKNQNLQL
ncbi:MAG: hypothetical protein ACLT40_07145 [Fusobacterium sp.]